MSDGTIKDGTGSGNRAKVSDGYRLSTTALTNDVLAYHTDIAKGYMVSTGEINLTSDSASGVFYLKNNEDKAIVIDSFNVCQEASVGGSGNTLVEVYRNPTTGTLVSSGTSIAPGNKNFSSFDTLNVDSNKGAEGLTVTDGTVLLTYFASTPSRLLYKEGPMLLEKGNSIAFVITPPTGSTNLGLCFSVQLYLQEEEV